MVGLRDLGRTTLGSSTPTAFFTKLMMRPAELGLAVAVTLLSEAGGDRKPEPLVTTWTGV